VHQAAWQFHRECEFGFACRDRLFQPMSLFEVAIGLARRNGAVLGQLLYRIGKMIDMLQQVPCTIEALGFLGLAGARHLS
jgi:hypothetical protein